MTQPDASFRDLAHRARRPEPDVAALTVDQAPREPFRLFHDWFADAVDAGVAQPQAAVLSTVSTGGGAAGRVVLLKDVDDAFSFSTSAESPKGHDVAGEPRVALTLFWPDRGRQVRVVGEVEPSDRPVAEQDFRHRHPETRAAAVAVRQSDPVPADDELATRLDEARASLEADPDLVPDDWRVLRVVPTSVEFWQGTTGRDQVRVSYRREGEGWSRTALWP
ncbi:pyridoxine/pyridoxamine 5'-phosphate oxidase [Frigoribacterium salinisoli]